MSNEETTAVTETKSTAAAQQLPEHLAKLSSDYPDIAQAIAANNNMLINRLADVVTPLANQAQAAYQAAEKNLLANQAPEFEARRPELEAWINSQPPTLQEYYKTTIANGSAQQRADVYSQFVKLESRNTPGKLQQSGQQNTSADWEAAVASVKKRFIHI